MADFPPPGGPAPGFPCRVLPYRVAPGPENLATDDVLLQAAEQGRAGLRFYGWSEPTLSLGYFQPHAPALAYPGLAGLPWLRRPSGGAALAHHHELTYALALPGGRIWQGDEPWIPRMHGLVAGVLAQLGVAAELVPPGGGRKLGEVLCFRHHTPGDLLVAGHKVAGSAQRKLHGALLQHGGILLAGSPHTPELPGIRELAGIDLPPEDLASRLAAALCHQTGWVLTPAAWTEGEQLAAGSARSRYGDPEWNRRR